MFSAVVSTEASSYYKTNIDYEKTEFNIPNCIHVVDLHSLFMRQVT